MPLNAVPGVQLQPSNIQTTLPTNYISYYDYTNQYLPDTHNQLVYRYGSQTLTGFLEMMSMETTARADQFIWGEEGRLHTVYNTVAFDGADTFTQVGHVFRPNEMIHINDGDQKVKALIITVPDADTFVAQPYEAGGFAGLDLVDLTVFVIGSEFRKGTEGMEGSLERDFDIYRNKPIIEKENYQVSGSDMTNIGWLYASPGDGTGLGEGWYWFLTSEEGTRMRFNDKLEMSLLEGELADAGSGLDALGYLGTEGMFETIRTRGNLFDGFPTTLAEWDTILERFDAQGKIQDYMYYCQRSASLAVDDLLGEFNSGYPDGVSYGIWGNDKDMVVNTGFKGFTRGTYNFFKTDWKLLNDPTTFGAVADAVRVRGVLAPVGTKEVYDGGDRDGNTQHLPFVHLKYKSSTYEERKMKIWITGGAGGAATNSLDAMRVNYLTERGLCTLSANNFMLMEGEN